MIKLLIGLLLGALIGAGLVWFYNEGRAKETVAAKIEALHLRPGDIKAELANTGKIVRRQAHEIGAVVSAAADDTRITATIKAKLVADPKLSAWKISVNTTNRRVTLSGTVTSPELIGKAILLAMETEGVTEVFSTLQVKKVTMN